MIQIMIILFMGTLDGMAIICAIYSLISKTLFFPLHLMSSLGALSIWWLSPMPRRFAPIIGCAIGPLGVLGGIMLPPVLGLIRRPPRPQPTKFTAQTSEADAEEDAGMALVNQLLDGRLYHPAPQSMGSLVTMIRFGSVPERIAALSNVVRNFDARLAEIVVHALNDPDQTVRALAAATAAQVTQTVAIDRDRLKSASSRARLEAAARLSLHAHHNTLLSDSLRAAITHEICTIPEATGRLIQAMLRPLDVENEWREQDFAAIDQIAQSLHTQLPLTQTDAALSYWLSRRSEQGAL